MKQRIISGVIMALILILIIVLNGVFPLVLNISLALMAAIGVHEFAKAVNLEGTCLMLPSVICAAVMPFTVIVPNGALLVYAVYTLLFYFLVIKNHLKIKYTEAVPLYAMTIIIPYTLTCVVMTRDLSEKCGLFYAFLCMLAAWLPDIGAYFAGTFFGKHKLCPIVSPKKTVEGFVGGIVFSTALMLLFAFAFTKLYPDEAMLEHYIMFALIGFGGSLISVVGDLTFSIIKREKGFKDYGTIIPGHGGILDRFDSVFFTSPFVYLVISYFISYVLA